MAVAHVGIDPIDDAGKMRRAHDDVSRMVIHVDQRGFSNPICAGAGAEPSERIAQPGQRTFLDAVRDNRKRTIEHRRSRRGQPGFVGARDIAQPGVLRIHPMQLHLRAHEAEKPQRESFERLGKAAGREQRTAVEALHHQERRSERGMIQLEGVRMRNGKARRGEALDSHALARAFIVRLRSLVEAQDEKRS